MTKVVNITDKLGLEPKPVIEIGDTRLTVDNSASKMLQLLDIIGDGEDISPATLAKASRLIFDDDSLEKLEAMDLSFEDYGVVVATAMELISGAAEGEDVTQATAS